jgi:hypothetical protein
MGDEWRFPPLPLPAPAMNGKSGHTAEPRAFTPGESLLERLFALGDVPAELPRQRMGADDETQPISAISESILLYGLPRPVIRQAEPDIHPARAAPGSSRHRRQRLAGFMLCASVLLAIGLLVFVLSRHAG